MASDRNGTPPEATKKDKPLSPLERVIHQAMGDDRTFGSDDDPAQKKYPALWEFMSRVYVGRDRIRQPSSIKAALGPGGVLAQLVDPDMKASLYVTCHTLDELWAILDGEAANPQAAWRPWGKGEPTLRKRRGGS